MGERLAKPPLIEAICEFRVREAPWTVGHADRVFERLGSEFSVRDVAMDLNVDAAAGSLTSRPRWLMKRPDELAMVQVTPASAPALSGALVVNHLRPYDRWQTFRDMIARALAGFTDALGTFQVERVGLRYINELPLVRPARIRDVLNVRPLPDALGTKGVINLYQRCEIPLHDVSGILIHQVGLGAEKAEGARDLFLDLDVGSVKPFTANEPGEMLAWLDVAHDQVGEAFTASITASYLDQLKRGT